MNRALKGVLWTLGAYAGLQVGARLIRRRWPGAIPSGWQSLRSRAQRPVDMEGLLAVLDLERGEHVLELGAGQGELTGAIAEALGATGRLVVVDPDPAQLASLVEQVGDLTNLSVQAADLPTVPLPDARFDRVLLGTGLGGMPHPERMIQEAFRVLKPHGRLVVVADARDLDFRSERRIVGLALAAGLMLRARQGRAWRYVLVFERPAAPSFLHGPHEEHRIETYG